MTTLETVATWKKKNEQTDEEAAAAVELVRMAQEQGLSRTGPNGLMEQVTKSVLESLRQ